MTKVMLIQLRAERNWTQDKLAKLAGVSATIIYKMEHGQPVNRANAEKVLACLGVKEEEVAGLEISKPVQERVNRRFVPWYGKKEGA